MSESPLRRMVLLVDRHEDTRDLYGHWFSSRAFDVVTTPRDEVALAIADAYRPDLIMTDLCADGLDGLRLVRQLRSSVDTRHIPIIVLTALVDPRLLVLARGAGAKVVRKLAEFDVVARHVAALPPEPRPEDRERRRQPLLARILGRSRAPTRRES